VQRLLAALGHDPGPVDGALGPRTRSAVEAFQRSRGRNAGGRVDEALLESLRDTQAEVAAKAQAEARALAAGQAAAEAAWRAIEGAQESSLFLKFADDYPQSPLAEAARSRANALAVALLKQDQAAAQAQSRQDPAPAVGPARQLPAQQPAQASPQELADWRAVMSRGRAEDFAAYLQAYPQGAFVREASYFMQQQPSLGTR